MISFKCIEYMEHILCAIGKYTLEWTVHKHASDGLVSILQPFRLQ